MLHPVFSFNFDYSDAHSALFSVIIVKMFINEFKDH